MSSATSPRSSAEVLLISAPWPNHTAPSIQIAALKAYLLSNGVEAVADHFFLRVAHWLGFETYQALFEPHLLDAEGLYGAMLFPEQMERVLASVDLNTKRLRVETAEGTLTIPSRLFFSKFAEMHEEALRSFDWPSITVVGLTLNFGQTLASAFIAARIKTMAPNVKIVIGGAEATGQLGQSLLEFFPQFDFACSGEGEAPLLALTLCARRNDFSDLPAGIAAKGRSAGGLMNQTPGLDALPVPDFDDYFTLLEVLGYQSLDVCQYLPFETSRGCYYSCSFCSLNLQWDGYRQKGPADVGEKIALLRNRHKIVDFFFVDNITPIGVDRIAETLSAHGVDYRYFYEARVNLRPEVWRSLASSGLQTAQLGIEALSDGLLGIYRKKATVLHNLHALKNCYENGISVTANLIVGHPLATEEHVQESLENFYLARAFPPCLSFSHYALLVGSPDYQKGLPGVTVVGNAAGYSRAYSDTALAALDLPNKAFHSCSGDGADFSPLIAAVEQWEDDYARLQARYGGRHPLLTYLDGGDFLLVEDWREGERRSFVLDEVERRIFLAIDQPVHVNNIAEQCGAAPSWIEGAVAAFANEGIAYAKDGRALALAIRKRGGPA